MSTSGLDLTGSNFGEADAKKMPSHLFHEALSIDHDTAVHADISKQDYTVCPRHWYIDVTYRCFDCGSEFPFSAKEQQFWYEERRFYVDSQPKRCVACRKKERQRKLQSQAQEGPMKKEANQPPQRNAGSRPSSGDPSASETPSSLGPRG